MQCSAIENLVALCYLEQKSKVQGFAKDSWRSVFPEKNWTKVSVGCRFHPCSDFLGPSFGLATEVGLRCSSLSNINEIDECCQTVGLEARDMALGGSVPSS